MSDAKMRILIADDEQIERIVLGRKLTKLLGSDSGYEIISASNGKEALDLYREKMPGVRGTVRSRASAFILSRPDRKKIRSYSSRRRHRHDNVPAV